MKIISVLFFTIVFSQVSCLQPTKPEIKQSLPKESNRQQITILAKILSAEDRRDSNELISLEKTFSKNMSGTAIRMAHASGRIPSWPVWVSLFEKYQENKSVINALAVACRYPGNKFPKIQVFNKLKTVPLSESIVETFLYLNIREAFDYLQSIDGYGQTIAANLWRSKDFINEKILKKYYAEYPVSTVYSAYRSKHKKIVHADDIKKMELKNRFYGCLVCDQPEKFLNDPAWQVRIAALRTLDSAKEARKMMNDKNPQIRSTAMQIFLKNDGDPTVIDSKSLTVWEASILASQIKNKQIIKEVFSKGDLFSEVTAPYLSQSDRNAVMSSNLSDKAKIMYLEKQFDKKEAITKAIQFFKADNSKFALEYLLYQKEGVSKEDIVHIAKKKGLFNSILIDYGYLKRTAVTRPLEYYLSVINKLNKVSGFKVITEKGTIACRFFPTKAPLTCFNFIILIEKKYFNGTLFHRVVPAFVTQDGDPSGTGAGGPGYSIRCEYNELKYNRKGLVGMALAGKDTGGSQYFITHLETPHLNHQYTIFAEVIEGHDIIPELCLYDRIKEILLW